MSQGPAYTEAPTTLGQAEEKKSPVAGQEKETTPVPHNFL